MVYLNPKNLPENDLVQALFENAILHAQNFARRLQAEEAVSPEAIAGMASEISDYAFAIMTFYLARAGRENLQTKVAEKYENFFLQNCGIGDIEARQQCRDAWHQEIQRKVAWLSMGDNTSNFDKNTFAQNILSDANLPVTESERFKMRPHAEQLVSDIQISMKRFGIVP